MSFDREKLREFLVAVQGKTKIQAPELIEKDFYLSFLLSALHFEEYVFKGGTCLAKAYLDYFRLSEDLDFTFADQKLFENLSTKKVKNICKEKINALGEQLGAVGMDFVFDKTNRKYVLLGSNNKIVTFKIHYSSLFTNAPLFIKIQVNFVEKLMFAPEKKEIGSLLNKDDLSKEDEVYYQEFLRLYEKRTMQVYDVREIAAEKLRSLLTRKAIKARDVIDLFFIAKKFNVQPQNLLREAREKIVFAINMYDKYNEYLLITKEKFKSTMISYDEVKHLVLQPVRKEEFDAFVTHLRPLLEKLMEEIERGKKP